MVSFIHHSSSIVGFLGCFKIDVKTDLLLIFHCKSKMLMFSLKTNPQGPF